MNIERKRVEEKRELPVLTGLYYHGMTLEQITKDIYDLIMQYGPQAVLTYHTDFDEEGGIATIKYIREETDKEYDQRVKRILANKKRAEKRKQEELEEVKKAMKAQEERDRLEYQRLRIKFEGK